MRIFFFPGFDLDNFTEANPHMRPIGQGRDFVDVVEVGSAAEVEAAGEEVSIGDRLTKLEKDFYHHSHMSSGGGDPCAGEIIYKWPKELRKELVEKFSISKAWCDEAARDEAAVSAVAAAAGEATVAGRAVCSVCGKDLIGMEFHELATMYACPHGHLYGVFGPDEVFSELVPKAPLDETKVLANDLRARVEELEAKLHESEHLLNVARGVSSAAACDRNRFLADRERLAAELATEKSQSAELLSGMAAQRDAAIRDGVAVCAKLDGVCAELAALRGLKVKLPKCYSLGDDMAMLRDEVIERIQAAGVEVES
jgi:hypothetical protein